jgi:hypothetical protein
MRLKTTIRHISTLLLFITAILTPQGLVSTFDHSEVNPSVYVYPQNVYAAVGTTFNVSVKVFNLTDEFYQTDIPWEQGEPLPPIGSRYNYSLGNIYGFNIRFKWNPEVLEFSSSLITTPREDFPEGVLYGPIVETNENVDTFAGTYTLAENSLYPVAGFNCPNESATFFTLTFIVKRGEPCLLDLESVTLLLDPVLADKGVLDIIHHVENGFFMPVATTRITGIGVGSLVGTQLLNPVIQGENASIFVIVANNGALVNRYNLTLYTGYVEVARWRNESLDPYGKRTYSYTLETQDLETGQQLVKAKAKIFHRNSILDSFTSDFTIVKSPLLSITKSKNEIHKNDTITLIAINNIQNDPTNLITKYSWSFFEPGASTPSHEYNGKSITHMFAQNGTWRVVLTVRDNSGITYDPMRNATFPYQTQIEFEVSIADGDQSSFVPSRELLALLIGFFMVVSTIAVSIHVRRKNRDWLIEDLS